MFKHSYTTSQPIKFCKWKGLRLDRVIECELIPNKKYLNHTLKLGYSYKVYGDSRSY